MKPKTINYYSDRGFEGAIVHICFGLWHIGVNGKLGSRRFSNLPSAKQYVRENYRPVIFREVKL